MNTCHGLWWDANVLYGVCRGPREPGDHWPHELGRPAPTDYQAAVFRAEDTTGDGTCRQMGARRPDHGGDVRSRSAPHHPRAGQHRDIIMGNNTFAPKPIPTGGRAGAASRSATSSRSTRTTGA